MTDLILPDFTIDACDFAGFRVKLEEPTNAAIQWLFAALYAQYHDTDSKCFVQPSHLLMHWKDHATLSNDIASNGSYCGVGATVPSYILRALNETTGSLVWLNTLVGIEQGSVIVGYLNV